MKIKNQLIFLRSLLVLTLLVFSIFIPLYSQDVIEKRDLYFYGPVIDADDPSRVQISTDLFYSQFQLDDTFSLIDRRSTLFSLDILGSHQGSSDVLFYNKIVENEEGWKSSLYLIDFSTGKEDRVQFTYNDYYKILIDAKDSVAALLDEYNLDTQGLTASGEENAATQEAETITISSLFGTWKAEEYVDKVVILRGGKGFVIFDNGASMNIAVTVEGNELTALQESKPNASFYPELPREVALVKALDGVPIEWKLTIENENSLSGVKHTYAANYDESGKAIVVENDLAVKWYR